MLRWIKRLLGIYETGYEYWIPLKDIKISVEFSRTRIGERKRQRKKEYYYRTGEFQSAILLKILSEIPLALADGMNDK